MTALHVLALDLPIHVHLLNRSYELSGGVAYSFDDANLLLNVPVAKMSAWAAAPDDFREWLEQRCPGRYQPTCFAQRSLYRDYLRNRIDTSVKRAKFARLIIHHRDVGRLERRDGRYLLFPEGTASIEVDAVVCAMGNCLFQARDKRGPIRLSDPRYVADPWDPNAVLQPRGEGEVVIIGSGLTAVDVVTRLRHAGCSRRIQIFSRHGLLPQAHRAFAPSEGFALPPLASSSPRDVARMLRLAVLNLTRQGGDWRQVVDALRPMTNRVWRGWTDRQKRQFLRHGRAYWDGHRHRMCADLAAKIEAEMQRDGVALRAARVLDIVAETDGLRVTWCGRGCGTPRMLNASLVVRCTGAEQLEPERTQPLVRHLLAQGMASLDPCRLGLATSDEGELMSADGQTTRNVFAIGSLRRGSLWETTAIPEIRVQAEELAKTLANRSQPEDAAKPEYAV